MGLGPGGVVLPGDNGLARGRRGAFPPPCGARPYLHLGRGRGPKQGWETASQRCPDGPFSSPLGDLRRPVTLERRGLELSLKLRWIRLTETLAWVCHVTRYREIPRRRRPSNVPEPRQPLLFSPRKPSKSRNFPTERDGASLLPAPDSSLRDDCDEVSYESGRPDPFAKLRLEGFWPPTALVSPSKTYEVR